MTLSTIPPKYPEIEPDGKRYCYCQENHTEADLHRNPCALDEPAEQVAAEVVRAQPMRCRWRLVELIEMLGYGVLWP